MRRRSGENPVQLTGVDTAPSHLPAVYEDPQRAENFLRARDCALPMDAARGARAEERGGPSSASPYDGFRRVAHSDGTVGCVHEWTVGEDHTSCARCGVVRNAPRHVSLYGKRDEAVALRVGGIEKAKERDGETTEFPVVTVVPAQPRGRCRVCALRRVDRLREFRLKARCFVALTTAACCDNCRTGVQRGGECAPVARSAVRRRECPARRRDRVRQLLDTLWLLHRGLTPDVGERCAYTCSSGDSNAITTEGKKVLKQAVDLMEQRAHDLQNQTRREPALRAVSAAIETVNKECDEARAPRRRLDGFQTTVPAHDDERGNEYNRAVASIVANTVAHIQTLPEMVAEYLMDNRAVFAQYVPEGVVHGYHIHKMLFGVVPDEGVAVLAGLLRGVAETMLPDMQRCAAGERYCCANPECCQEMRVGFAGIVNDPAQTSDAFWTRQVTGLQLVARALSYADAARPALLVPHLAHELVVKECEEAFFRTAFFATRASHTATAAFAIVRAEEQRANDGRAVEQRRAELARDVSVCAQACVFGLWRQFFVPCFDWDSDSGMPRVLHSSFQAKVVHQKAAFALGHGSGSFDGVVVARMVSHAASSALSKDVARLRLLSGDTVLAPLPARDIFGGRSAPQYFDAVKRVFQDVRARCQSLAAARGEFRRVERTTESPAAIKSHLLQHRLGNAGATMTYEQMEQSGATKERLHPTDFKEPGSAQELALWVTRTAERMAFVLPNAERQCFEGVDALPVARALGVSPLAFLFVAACVEPLPAVTHYARSAAVDDGERDQQGNRIARRAHSSEVAKRLEGVALRSAASAPPLVRATSAPELVPYEPHEQWYDRLRCDDGDDARAPSAPAPPVSEVSKAMRALATGMKKQKVSVPPRMEHSRVAYANGIDSKEVLCMKGMIKYLCGERQRLALKEPCVAPVGILRGVLRDYALPDEDVEELFTTIVDAMVHLHLEKTTYGGKLQRVLETRYIVDFLCRVAQVNGLQEEQELTNVLRRAYKISKDEVSAFARARN
jgi:hypothetical protein